MKKYFFAACLVLLTLSYNRISAQGPEWVRDNTWFFDNFKDSNVSWNVFRESYIGVAPSRSLDFDGIFFDELFTNTLYNPGNCYGIDVMAMLIMKNGGRLGYCHPPYVYDGKIHTSGGDSTGPSDHNLKIAIEMTHANQANYGFLSFMLDVLAKGKLRDGNYAYFQVQQYLAMGDQPILCISDTSGELGGLASKEGHVIVPYKTEESGGIKKIYVYDPNRSYYASGADGKDFYEGGNNVVTIDGSNHWFYPFIGGDMAWNGSPDKGGRLVAVPLSIAGRKDRLPQSLISDGLLALETLIIFAGKDTKLEQITDLRTGRHLLNKDGSDVEPDSNKCMRTILPFTVYGGGKNKQAGRSQFYFYRSKNSLDIKVRGKDPYKIGVMFNGKYREYKSVPGKTVQHFRTPGLVEKRVKKPIPNNLHSSVGGNKD